MPESDRLPPAPRGRALACTIIAALALLAILAALDAPLRTDEAGSGTISLELAGSEGRATEIVDSWRDDGETARAAFVLGLDYLYAPLAALGLAGLCLAVGRRLGRVGNVRLAAASVPLAWCALASGAFDLGENTALAPGLIGGPESPWPQVALAFASAKFALSGVALAYVVLGGGLSLARRSREAPA